MPKKPRRRAPDESDLEANIAPDALRDDLRRRDQPPTPPDSTPPRDGEVPVEVVSLRRPTAATSSIRSTTRIRKTLRRATTSARSTGWMVPCGRADEAISGMPG